MTQETGKIIRVGVVFGGVSSEKEISLEAHALKKGPL